MIGQMAFIVLGVKKCNERNGRIAIDNRFDNKIMRNAK